MLAASGIPAAPVLGVMALGVLVAVAGHATRIRGMVALGLILLFGATAGMIVGGFASFHQGDTDPRTQCSPYQGVGC